jgi:hypothetical protein
MPAVVHHAHLVTVEHEQRAEARRRVLVVIGDEDARTGAASDPVAGRRREAAGSRHLSGSTFRASGV